MRKGKELIDIYPGITIKEQLDNRNMTQKEFALRMGMSEKHISKLINGEVILTPEVAARLEMVFAIPSSFWMNLENIYRDRLQIINREIENKEEIKISKQFPYEKMAKLDWVSIADNDLEKVINLRKYFEVSSLLNLQDPLYPKVVYVKESINEKSKYALLTWAQKAKIEARNIETKVVSIPKLKKSITEIEKLTKKNENEIKEQLVNILAECGVAIVFLPYLEGNNFQSATFPDRNKIVIGITLNDKNIRKFWYSLFYEIGLIIKGYINLETITDIEESDAFGFAREILENH